MTRGRVEELLTGYKVSAARAAFLEVRISEDMELLDSYNRHAADYMTGATPVYGSAGGGGPMGSKVERIALTLASGETPPDVRDIREELDALRQERARLLTLTGYVDAWLRGLNEREHLVLTSHLIEAHTWREVSVEYEQRYGLEYSRTGLKGICMRALDKIYTIAGASGNSPETARKQTFTTDELRGKI